MKSIKLALVMALALPAFGRDGGEGGGIVVIDRGHRGGEIQIGEMVTGGTACNYEGSVDVAIENDKLKFKFDDFSATLRGARIERATCLVSAQLSWPQGSQVVIRDLSLRGQAAVSSGTRASVSAEVFTTGGFGQALSAPVSGIGPIHEKESGEVYRTDCSGSGLLRLNSNIRLIGASYWGGAGQVEINKLTAEISLEPCH